MPPYVQRQNTLAFNKKTKRKKATSLLQHVLLAAVLPFLFLLTTGFQPVSPIDPIQLKAEPLPFTPKEFYLAEVLDERSTTKAVALLITGNTKSTTPQGIDLQGGGLAAVKAYIAESLPRNPSLRPIQMRLKEYQVTETPGANGKIDGRVSISASFEVQREGQMLHLFEYKSGARYSRPAAQLGVVEPTLRKVLSESLRYLDLWVNQEAPHNEKLARNLKVTFSDYTRNTEEDTLFYDVNRPLQWSDFKGGSPRGGFAASIFPFISNDIHAVVKNGTIYVDIQIKTYMVRSLSRSRADARNAYGLNHEQRHFDLVKLVTEHYKQRIRKAKLTLADYDSMIKYQYLEELWELDALQKKYDTETNHGLNATAQTRWNQKIEEELASLGLRKPSL